MESFQNRKHVLLQMMEQIAQIAESCSNQDIAKDTRVEADHLRAGELNVDVCGEAKRGKSSLLNAFLEEAGLCPVDAPVATNVITTVRYGESEQILVHLESDETKDICTLEISRDELKDYVSEQGNRGNQRKVKLVQIWLPNAKLKSGLVLIDTPGVGSLNVDHTAATYAIVPYADAVLFTGSADQPLTEPELDFAEKIKKHTSNLMFVLTKRDRVTNSDERLQEDTRKLACRLGVPVDSIPAVSISSTIKMEYLHDLDDDVLQMSGFPELERILWRLLEKRSDILLGRARGRMLAAISELRFPLEKEREALESKSDAARKSLQIELETKVARAEELSSDSPIWMGNLNTAITKLQARCAKEMAVQLAELNDAVDRYLKISDYVDHPEKLGTMLTVDSNNSFAVILDNVEKEIGDIVLSLRNITSLDLETGGATIDASSDIQLPSTFQRHHDSGLKRAADLGRSSTWNSMGLGTVTGFAGAMLGGIIGTFAGPGGTVGGVIIGGKLGSAAGAVVGSIFGLKRGLDDATERNLMASRKDIGDAARRQLAIAHRDLSFALNDLLVSVRSDVHEGMLRQIKHEKQACQKAIEGLERARRMSTADAIKEIQNLSNLLKRLQQLQEMASQGSAEGSAQYA